MLSRHFLDPTNVEENGVDGLDGLVWRPDEKSGILIESIYRWTGNYIGKRPAVIIKPNAMTNLRLGIVDDLGSDVRGMREFETFWIGSHTVFCLHGTGAGAEILAGEVLNELSDWHPLFVKYVGLMKWQITEVGGVSILEEDQQTFVVPITVGWVFSRRWRIDWDSMKLRKITFSIHTILDGALQGTVQG